MKNAEIFQSTSVTGYKPAAGSMKPIAIGMPQAASLLFANKNSLTEFPAKDFMFTFTFPKKPKQIKGST